MSEMAMSEARDHLADVVERARREHEPVWLHRRGKRLAAVIDADDLDRLTELAQDALDREELARVRDEGGQPIPWEQIRADLGL
jgi:prevent-host-death family protein